MAFGLFSLFLSAQTNSRVFFSPLKSCPDPLALTVGPLSAPMPICACSLHAACFSIFHVVMLGLGVPCCLVLGVVCPV